jgi:hypothetical protein
MKRDREIVEMDRSIRRTLSTEPCEATQWDMTCSRQASFLVFIPKFSASGFALCDIHRTWAGRQSQIVALQLRSGKPYP